MLDDTDRRLLRHLLGDPTLSTGDLAEQTGVSAATVWRRLERLAEQGIIRAQEAVIDWRALGYGVEVSLRFTLDKTAPRAFDDFIAAARSVPEVLAIETFLGRVDLRLNVIARDMAHWQDIYRDRILTLPHISDIEALMLVSTLKNAEALPV
ncbi:Lrp/AsnC family transcriptional regulator [Falsirhodobacter algicola]|uniref:Winged helix-turn-helix transcriptional regulator n=1 Tax=Falsirhodobacter algicola TaxID=2692330 RepID=A0A8J8SK22_9RHOB|nr:Lrp/AsnC family transcriptional regulator [Falsirhodobacter algicola]QUS34902.1 winged helix-turn-helix transcriptional regulator [Falsirhodobacter algicola]